MGGSSLKLELSEDEILELDEILKISDFEDYVSYRENDDDLSEEGD